MTPKVTANVRPIAPERKELPGPGRELFQIVRGGLIARGTSVRGWAEANSYNESTVRYALYGLSDTEDSKRIRAEAMRDAGLIEGDEERTDR